MHTHIRSNDHILLHTKGPFFIKTSKQYNEISDTVRSLSSLQLKNKHIVKYLCVPRPPEFYTIGSKRGNTLHTQIRNEISKKTRTYLNYNSQNRLLATAVPTQRVLVISFPHVHYIRIKGINSCELNQTLHYDLRQTTKSNQQTVLIQGTHMNSGAHLPVARSFQTFLKNSHRFGP